jgi:hypothetical protein
MQRFETLFRIRRKRRSIGPLMALLVPGYRPVAPHQVVTMLDLPGVGFDGKNRSLCQDKGAGVASPANTVSEARDRRAQRTRTNSHLLGQHLFVEFPGRLHFLVDPFSTPKILVLLLHFSSDDLKRSTILVRSLQNS